MLRENNFSEVSRIETEFLSGEITIGEARDELEILGLTKREAHQWVNLVFFQNAVFGVA